MRVTKRQLVAIAEQMAGTWISEQERAAQAHEEDGCRLLAAEVRTNGLLLIDQRIRFYNTISEHWQATLPDDFVLAGIPDEAETPKEVETE